MFNIKFNDCVADYGAAIASVGSFELQGATISSCTATSGIGDAIFLAGVLYLDQNNSIEGDVAIASNETNGTHRDDYSATILGSSVKIPYRTGSIVCLSAQSSTIALTFCDFTVSLTGSITVTNSSTNCDKFYVQGEVLIYSGTNTFITNYFTLPSGYAWTEHYDDNDSFDGFTLIK